MVELSATAVTARLREACALLAAPVVPPDRGAPTEAEVTARLREACGLWVACAELAKLGRSAG